MDLSVEWEREQGEREDYYHNVGMEACRMMFHDGGDITINPYGKNNALARGWETARRDIENEDGL